MPQIAYAHSVRDFIRKLLRWFIPGKWIDRVISDQDANFDEKLGAAFAGLNEKTAREKDYCAKVVSVLCDVGAVLEDKASDDGATFGAAEIRKANAELRAFAAANSPEPVRDIPVKGEILV